LMKLPQFHRSRHWNWRDCPIPILLDCSAISG
jgi:hypothetical protein